MRLLGITTSTPQGSAAVLVDGRVAGGGAYVDLQGHAERIFDAIDAALAEAGLARRDLDAIACDVGPGSFTGVRVGVASSKGIAFALGVPVVAVGSLEAIAEAAFTGGVAGPDELVLAGVDAKKNELFAALYDASLTPRIAPRLVARDAAAIDGLVAGASALGVVRCVGEWPQAGASAALPRAASVARVGAARLAAGNGASAAALEAVYVRAPDAKIPGT